MGLSFLLNVLNEKTLKIINFFKKNYNVIIKILFIAIFIIGLIASFNYGVAFDEHIQRSIAVANAKYIIQGNPSLKSINDRYYGPVIEILLLFLEKIFRIKSATKELYLMRHSVGFAIFYTGAVFFYLLCKKIFKSKKLALLGFIFLLFSPRITSESFINTKDIPFMSFFIISMFTMYNFLENKNLLNAVLHSLICAIAIDIRIMGIVIPLLTFIFFITDLILKNCFKQLLIKEIRNLIIFIFLTIFFTTLFFPVTWTNPLHYFTQAFKLMSRYTWQGYNLYLGEFIKASNFQWHYPFIWILITTPLLYLITFLIGFYISIKKIIKDPKETYNNFKFLILALSVTSISLFSVIIFKSILYGGWRQLYFIYPSFLIISLFGFKFLHSYFKTKHYSVKNIFLKVSIYIFILAILTSITFTTKHIIKNYPYEYVYFNFLAGTNYNNIKDLFPLEYWGTVYREGLEYILKNDKDKNIKIYATNDSARWNYNILDTNEKKD